MKAFLLAMLVAIPVPQFAPCPHFAPVPRFDTPQPSVSVEPPMTDTAPGAGAFALMLPAVASPSGSGSVLTRPPVFQTGHWETRAAGLFGRRTRQVWVQEQAPIPGPRQPDSTQGGESNLTLLGTRDSPGFPSSRKDDLPAAGSFRVPNPNYTAPREDPPKCPTCPGGG